MPFFKNRMNPNLKPEEIMFRQNFAIKSYQVKEEPQKNIPIFTNKTQGEIELNDTQHCLLFMLADANYEDPNDPYDVLTEKDLEVAYKRYLKNKDSYNLLGFHITDFNYNKTKGTVRISTDIGETLEIDLQTKAEGGKVAKNETTKAEQSSSTSSEKQPTVNSNKVQSNDNGEKHYSDRSLTTPIPKFYEQKKELLAKQFGISIAALEEKIADVAKRTGYSEYYITHIISTEDFVSPAKDIGDGVITAGFGHTSRRDASVKAMKGKKINVDTAFNWIVSDIKYFEEKIKNMKIGKDADERFSKYFDQLPLSLREAVIDVAFNRDADKLESADEYKHLRANIKNGDENLPASAMRLRQNFSQYTHKQKLGHTFTTGLMKRNVYRFLLAIRDFDAEYRAAAKRRFENENSYYSETIDLLKEKKNATEASLLEQAWRAME